MPCCSTALFIGGGLMNLISFSPVLASGVSSWQGRVSYKPRRGLKHRRLSYRERYPASFCSMNWDSGLSLASLRVASYYYLLFQLVSTIVKKACPVFSILGRQVRNRQLLGWRWFNYTSLLFTFPSCGPNPQTKTARALDAIAEAPRVPRPRISRGASHSQRDGRNPVLSLRGLRV